jgi:hypothetical protein
VFVLWVSYDDVEWHMVCVASLLSFRLCGWWLKASLGLCMPSASGGGTAGTGELRGQPELGEFSDALHTVAAYSRALCHDGSAAFTQRGIDRRESFPVTPTVTVPPRSN